MPTRLPRAAGNEIASRVELAGKNENGPARKPRLEVFFQEVLISRGPGTSDNSRRFDCRSHHGAGLRAPHAALAGAIGPRIVCWFRRLSSGFRTAKGARANDGVYIL